MIPPKDAQVFDMPTSTIWFNEDGIMYSVAKKVPPQSLEQAKASMERFLEITGGKKVCLLSDSTDSPPVDKELRDYAAQVFPNIVKAIAIMSRSSVGKMAANLFFAIKKQPYPVRFFDDEEEARIWLKQYL